MNFERKSPKCDKMSDIKGGWPCLTVNDAQRYALYLNRTRLPIMIKIHPYVINNTFIRMTNPIKR